LGAILAGVPEQKPHFPKVEQAKNKTLRKKPKKGAAPVDEKVVHLCTDDVGEGGTAASGTKKAKTLRRDSKMTGRDTSVEGRRCRVEGYVVVVALSWKPFWLET
jgi:hypothetical protein